MAFQVAQLAGTATRRLPDGGTLRGPELRNHAAIKRVALGAPQLAARIVTKAHRLTTLTIAARAWRYSASASQ
jgi:hypothetical protein